MKIVKTVKHIQTIKQLEVGWWVNDPFLKIIQPVGLKFCIMFN